MRGNAPPNLLLSAMFLVGIVIVVAMVTKRKRLEQTVLILIGIVALLLFLIEQGEGSYPEMAGILILILTILFMILGLGILIGAFFKKK
jgi:Ca2+/Na+ antiporter